MSNPYGQHPGDAQNPGDPQNQYSAQTPYGPQDPYGGPPGSVPGAKPPGETLGLVGLILACIPFCFLPLVGLILSLVARSQSKAVGYDNKKARIGIIVGSILVALWLLLVVVGGISGAFEDM